MTDLNKKTGCGNETSALHMEKDGSIAITETAKKQESNGLFGGFFAQLIEAHRYVHNRRNAAHH